MRSKTVAALISDPNLMPSLPAGGIDRAALSSCRIVFARVADGNKLRMNRRRGQ
jgi:hypothetical protein